jgi:acetyl-CoA carboxylase biotin carboxyl carrier protein
MTAAGDHEAILDALRELLPRLEEGGVTELDVSAGGARLYVKRRPGPAPILQAAFTPGGGPAGSGEEEGLVPITTPLSGVFYASPAPEEPPYVQEGDAVEAGQTVALVEAMKVFNEIHAEVEGTVARVMVTAGQLVQSGQTLMLIRPAEDAPMTGEAV